MGCQHLDELHELWLLGALEGEAARELEEHVRRGCPHCLARVREAAQMVYLLGTEAKPVHPPPRVKTELLSRIFRKSAPEG